MADDIELQADGAYDGLDLSAYGFDERDLAGLRLSNCTIARAQLSAVILQDATFTDCRFLNCRFAHADLREAKFVRCTFADLENHAGCDFAFCRMEEARFEACDLSFADMDRSNLWAVHFADTNLRGARFHRADFSRAFGPKVVRHAAAFLRCNLELCDLSDARLPGGELTGSSLREADLTEADLQGADLSGCDLFQALTAGAKLAGADLRGAELSGLDLTQLGSFAGAKITLSQQHLLLTAMGLDVHAD
jgi:fluoroquinolone resistance protein